MSLILKLLGILLIINLIVLLDWFATHNASFYFIGTRLFVTYEKVVKGDWGIKENRVFTKEITFRRIFKGFR
jgi:hypothetical protein